VDMKSERTRGQCELHKELNNLLPLLGIEPCLSGRFARILFVLVAEVTKAYINPCHLLNCKLFFLSFHMNHISSPEAVSDVRKKGILFCIESENFQHVLRKLDNPNQFTLLTQG
jgi:hypothetical protein